MITSKTAGYAGLDAAGFKERLDAASLRAVSAHISFDKFRDIESVKSDMRDLCITNAAIPNAGDFYYPKSAAGYTAAAEKMEEFASKLAECGFGLSYHNHRSEFALYGPARGEDYILNTAKSLGLQLDCGHCRAANDDPAEWIRRYPDRIFSVHAKDINFDFEGKRYDTPIGTGWSIGIRFSPGL